MEKDSIRQIRCSSCGRFLGYAMVENGIVLILCKNCKGWSIIAEGDLAKNLTTEDIYAILQA